MSKTSLLTLVAVVFVTALAVVYVKHESRKLFVDLQGLELQRDNLDVEWGRLQLEESTWAAHGRVENVAHTQLGMGLPPKDQVVLVRP